MEDASIQHLDTLYKIETMCFKNEAFTKQQILNLLTAYNCISLIAKVNGEIVGFIIGAIYTEKNLQIGHILTIDVSPNYQRKGIAQKLLQEIEKIFKEKNVKTCQLEVREDNLAALRLYEKFGYKKVAVLKGYYEDAHGIRLKKSLT